LLSCAHFSVDGTLLAAWASPGSLRPKDARAIRAARTQSPAPAPARGYDAGGFVMELPPTRSGMLNLGAPCWQKMERVLMLINK
jgi:hypothetical protein